MTTAKPPVVSATDVDVPKPRLPAGDDSPARTDPSPMIGGLVPENPLVRNLVGDPGDLPRVVLFSGYAGESQLPEHIRLYLDDQLRTWIDIPQEAVRHNDVLQPDATRPRPMNALWVGPDDGSDRLGRPVMPGGELNPGISDVRDLEALWNRIFGDTRHDAEPAHDGVEDVTGGKSGGGLPTGPDGKFRKPPPPPRHR